MSHQTDSSSFSGLAPWVAAAAVTFVVAGTVDWGRALWASTDPGSLGPATSWLVFAALWLVGGVLWGLVTAGGLWAATGTASGIPLVDRLADRLQRWWDQRGTEEDARRVATLVAGAAALVAFGAASLGWTTHLIEERNLAWLIAVTALTGQLVVAVALFGAALALRRLLEAVLVGLRRRGRLNWLHLPAVAGVVGVGGVVALFAALVVGSEVYRAVEGPGLTLVVIAILAHPVVGGLVARRIGNPPWLRRSLWAAPVVALVVAATVSQHSDARRILVLHADAAHFAFNQIHRHVDVDRLFDRGACPDVGPEGRPVDGTPFEEFAEECLDPAYDRPTAREQVPDYERPEFDERPSFVFVTWDSVRIDRLGHMDHDRNTTPNLDAFAAGGVVFERAFTQDSGTGPSFWSLTAGKTPFQVSLKHAEQFPPPIDLEDEQMLGELFAEAGYRTEAIMCGTLFDREIWGIEAGFGRFDNVCGSDRTEVAPVVTEQAVEAFEELEGGDDPFFLWVHYFDPHHPYTSHPEIGYGEDKLDRYDEELTYTDDHFGQFMEVVDRARDGDRPLYVVFGADHGENFGEHGPAPHARNLYRNVTHVPMIVDGPGIEPGRVEPPVAFNDVYPTVLELAGIEVPAESTMVSQVPVLFGAEADQGRMVFQENSFSRPRRHTRAVVYDRYQYIKDLTTHSHELYDYVDDPLQRNNLVGTGLDEEQIMRQALIRFLHTTEIPEELKD